VCGVNAVRQTYKRGKRKMIPQFFFFCHVERLNKAFWKPQPIKVKNLIDLILN